MKLLMSKERLVRSRVLREYNKFQYRIMKMKKEEIINQCCKLHFYGCVKEYFQYNEAISEDEYEFLFGKKDILHTMWELYLKYEQFGCSTWEQVEEILAHWMYG